MSALVATYRLQLRNGTTFARARALAPYLERLGVSHLYLSPVLAARRGSAHGYDVTDPARVDASLGGERGLVALAAELRGRGLRILLDIVPNHAAADAENPHFDDVLRRGRASRYAPWFDIDWSAGAIALPFLGEPPARALARGHLSLAAEKSGVRVRYFERSFPLHPETLPPEWRAAPPGPRELDAFCRGAGGRARLADLLARQAYRLCDWRSGPGAPSYRRFFDIDDLIALRVEDPAVFEATHAKLLELLARDLVDGLRVDHVDGLADPRAYLQRLRSAAGRARADGGDPPIWVEKILARGERLRADWPVQGATGYAFLNELEAVLVHPDGTAQVEADWRRLTRRRASFAQTARAGKRLVLGRGLAPDVRRLVRSLAVELDAARARDLRRALVETLAALPVYRTYADARGRLGARERRLLERALAEARRAGAPAGAVRRLAGALLGGVGAPAEAQRVEALRRFEQLSGPAAAKGVEDTALYVHAPLASLCEVGGEPDVPLERAVAAFHAEAAERARRWPHALLAGSTHDSKRSADVRARLDVLSELPDAWRDAVRRWRRHNGAHRRRVRGRRFPDANAEYLLYQTLVGIWPLSHTPPLAQVEERVQRYMRKAVREAKVHTSWRRPNEGYEAALEHFVRALLRPRPRAARSAFARELDAFARQLERPGLWNALARLLVQLTAPGVPDLYQGDELWSFALVDPDNRGRVDFALRRRLLGRIERRFASGAASRRRLIRELVAAPEDGRIKLYTTWRALQTRRGRPELFAAADYAPLRARGPHARHVLAFARGRGASLALVAVPRLPRTLVGNARDAPCGERVWGRTALALPRRTGPGVLRSALTDERIALARDTRAVGLARLLASFPVGLWLWEPEARGAPQAAGSSS